MRRFVLAGALFWATVTTAWWLLALWPVANAPVWLERTRYVCFGVNETGLPDAGGWIGLIAGPIGMLAILVAGWRRSVGRAAVAIVLITLVMITAGASWRITKATPASALAEQSPPSTYPRLDRAAPALELRAEDGRVHSLEEFKGRIVLVTFAYAHCETICPLVVTNTLRAQQQLAADHERPVVLIVTLDPWRDTPSRLAAMAGAWQLPTADAHILSGEIANVEAALDAWDVPRRRDARTGEVTHPSVVYMIGRDGRIAYASTGGTDAIVALARRLHP